MTLFGMTMTSSPTQKHPRATNMRRLSGLDRLLTEAGQALQVLAADAQAARPNPAGKRAADEPALDPQEKRHAAGLMRVNHVGEVCAQALYRGQAVFCEDEKVRDLFIEAASEEVDHLVWCQERLRELDSRPSYLNPFWYAGSFGLGLLAGKASTARNLGFMAETEAQVEQHLDSHLRKLPADDHRSRAIVRQMRDDEIAHRTSAEKQGASRLPLPLRLGMRAMSKVMTGTAYYF